MDGIVLKWLLIVFLHTNASGGFDNPSVYLHLPIYMEEMDEKQDCLDRGDELLIKWMIEYPEKPPIFTTCVPNNLEYFDFKEDGA